MYSAKQPSTPSDDLVFCADMRIAHPTLIASAADDVRFRRDHVSYLEAILVSSTVPQLHDLPKSSCPTTRLS